MAPKKTPMQRVRERWSTKEKAAQAIVGLIGDPDGETLRRLRRASNEQLLRLYEVGQRVKEKFGGRTGLIDAIVQARFPQGKGGEAYRRRLEGYGIRRLADLYRQVTGKKV